MSSAKAKYGSCLQWLERVHFTRRLTVTILEIALPGEFRRERPSTDLQTKRSG